MVFIVPDSYLAERFAQLWTMVQLGWSTGNFKIVSKSDYMPLTTLTFYSPQYQVYTIHIRCRYWSCHRPSPYLLGQGYGIVAYLVELWIIYHILITCLPSTTYTPDKSQYSMHIIHFDFRDWHFHEPETHESMSGLHISQLRTLSVGLQCAYRLKLIHIVTMLKSHESMCLSYISLNYERWVWDYNVRTGWN